MSKSKITYERMVVFTTSHKDEILDVGSFLSKVKKAIDNNVVDILEELDSLLTIEDIVDDPAGLAIHILDRVK